MDNISAFLSETYHKITAIKIAVAQGDAPLLPLILFYLGVSAVALLTGSADSAQLVRRWVRTFNPFASFSESLLSGVLTLVSSVPRMISAFFFFFFLSLICFVKCLFAVFASLFLGLILAVFADFAWKTGLRAPLPVSGIYACVGVAFLRLFGRTTAENIRRNLYWRASSSE